MLPKVQMANAESSKTVIMSSYTLTRPKGKVIMMNWLYFKLMENYPASKKAN